MRSLAHQSQICAIFSKSYNMKIKIKNELILIDILVVALILIISFFPQSIWRVILGLPFLLFCPGYLLISALFPRGEGISITERIALSCGSSIAIVALIGIILHFASLGIRLGTILYSVSTFAIVMSVIAWWRRRRIPQQQQFVVGFDFELPDWDRNKLLLGVLTISLLGMIGMITYLIIIPQAEVPFTEFYVLGQNGEAADFNRILTTGDTEQLTIGIANHEQQEMSYYLEVAMSGTVIQEIGPISLQDKENQEQPVTLQFPNVGNGQEVELILLKEVGGESYRILRLWYDVKEKIAVKS